MPSMSYCVCQNTNIDLNKIVSMMGEYDTIEEYIDSLSNDERRAFHSIVDKCRDVVEYMEYETVDY